MTHQSSDIKKNTLHRLKIARGHMDKVISMVENDEYCIDVLHQSRAVQSALKAVDKVVLENHLNTCVISQIKDGNVNAVKEIIEIFEKK